MFHKNWAGGLQMGEGGPTVQKLNESPLIREWRMQWQVACVSFFEQKSSLTARRLNMRT